MINLYLRFTDAEAQGLGLADGKALALYVAESMANVDSPPIPAIPAVMADDGVTVITPAVPAGPEHGWLTTFPPDGHLGGIYYVIQPVFGTGIVYSTDPTGTEKQIDMNGNEVDVPTYTLRDGFHVNGLWGGTEDDLPDELKPFRVYPETPALVFG